MEPFGLFRSKLAPAQQPKGLPMAKKGIISTAGETISDAAGGAASLAASAGYTVAKAATGTALTAVRGARRLVGVKKKRRSPKRHAAGRKAARTRKLRKVKTAAKRKVTRVAKKVRKAVRRKKR
jgi:hypothetical protein